MCAAASEDAELRVPVLVVGGSLVGLTTALLLRRHGVDVLAVERHSGTAIHPRAGHFNLRTVEILRSLGLEQEVRRSSERSYPPDGGISNVESLAGREIANYFDNLNDGVEQFSPTIRLFLDQDALEPMLRDHATQAGAQLLYRTEATALQQDSDGVSVIVRDLESGAERRIRADYVVAADGNRSPIREQLGIAMHGHGVLSNSATIYFRAEADLEPLLRGRNQGVQYVTSPLLRGFFRLNRAGNGGFLAVNLIGDTARPEIVAAYPDAPWANVAEGITEERALELLRAAIGVPGMPLVITDIAPWQAVADCAERFQDGRVFLAGDAAHVVPPNGGFGGNMGIQDAHNLAWKLALVLRGEAGPTLLDSYDTERRAVGGLTVEQSYTRYVTRVAPYIGTEGMQPLVDDLHLEIGYRYNSPAVIAEPGTEPLLHTHPAESHGEPGSHAPHVVLSRDGASISTLDLFGTNYVVLAGPDGARWCAAFTAAAAHLGIAVDAHRVGADGLTDPNGGFLDAYGINPAGGSVVRPDGFVGWRTSQPEGADDARAREVLELLLCRSR
ncbi:MAG: FAD-dependent monooxygenase [Solirubrobacteraceae bacterium]